MPFDTETAIGVVILFFFAYVIWRGGKAHPVGTGQLQKQLNTIGGEVRVLAKRVDGCAITADVERLRGEIREMEARVASSAEVIALEGKIGTLVARLDGMDRVLDRVDNGVQRIEGFFLQKGIER